ncbi:MAG: DUF523 domain-containing protein [Bacteroidales bacterium]|nr:DUF523 domain-containing protein [Bacteroidales bacterium]
MLKKKVIISACLLGYLCRYDGKTKKVLKIVDAFSNDEIIPFCPEAPLFGTPRERISVLEIDGVNKIISNDTNRDVTQLLEDEIKSFVKLHPNVQKIVLKSKSPSCGNGTTPIVNEEKKVIKLGDGLATKIFKQVYKDIKIKDELNYL